MKFSAFQYYSNSLSTYCSIILSVSIFGQCVAMWMDEIPLSFGLMKYGVMNEICKDKDSSNRGK